MVIGEVGGSSSRWALIKGDEAAIVLPVEGRPVLGFNPLNGDPDLFLDDLRAAMAGHAPGMARATQVVVYGAGCGTPERRSAMARVLARMWPQADVHVETDLTGAAHGLLGAPAGGTGLVLILGTGMNAGYHDGTRTITPMPSLGWLLGDEGSGADIGRAVLRDALHRRMPEALRTALFGPHGPDPAQVLAQVHRSPFPARALAAHAALLAPYMHEPYVQDLLRSRFLPLADLLVRYFPEEQRRTVHAVGSVAYGFRQVLAECLLHRGMRLMAVEPDPLPGLVRHHRR